MTGDEPAKKNGLSSEARIYFAILGSLTALMFGATIFNVVASVLTSADRSSLISAHHELRKDFIDRFDAAAREYSRMIRSTESLKDRLSGDLTEIKVQVQRISEMQSKVQLVPVIPVQPVAPVEPKSEEAK